MYVSLNRFWLCYCHSRDLPIKLRTLQAFYELRQLMNWNKSMYLGFEWPAHPVTILNCKCSYSVYIFLLFFYPNLLNIFRFIYAATPYMNTLSVRYMRSYLATALTYRQHCMRIISLVCVWMVCKWMRERIAHTLDVQWANRSLYINFHYKIANWMILTVNVFNRHSSDTKCNARCEDVLWRFYWLECSAI